MSENHHRIYSKAFYYDVAFSFKNGAEENQTILEIFKKHTGKIPRSFLDIAAGPAANAIDMGKRGLQAFAIDYSQEMVQYGREKASAASVPINYFHGDMRNFELPTEVDLAAIFMDSTSYLISNDDFVSHLKSVAEALSHGGIYILEMSHPRDVFNTGSSAETDWEIELGDIKVKMQWGYKEDLFDPIRQVTRVTSKLTYHSPSEKGEVIDSAEQRCFTYAEVQALVKLSGCFEMVETLGSLKPNISFSNAKESWRMIPVLRKI